MQLKIRGETWNKYRGSQESFEARYGSKVALIGGESGEGPSQIRVIRLQATRKSAESGVPAGEGILECSGGRGSRVTRRS